MNPSSSYFAKYRPRLEALEPRLPPGDAVLGILIAWPEISSESIGLEEDLSATRLLKQADTTRLDFQSQSIESRRPVPTTAMHQPSTELMSAASAEIQTAGSNPISRHALTLNGNTPALAAYDVSATTSPNPAFHTSRGFATPAPVDQAIGMSAVASASPNLNSATDSDQSRVAENYGKLPLSFEENVGQSDSRVDFMARAGGYTAFLTPTGAVFSIQNSEFRIQNSESEPEALATVSGPTAVAYASGSEEENAGLALHMEIVGAKPQAAVGREPLPGKVNYFIGNDSSQWRTNISTFGRVEYDDVYPGIDLVYYGKDQQLEYDFIVAPGADPDLIQLNFEGADGAKIDADGNLLLDTGAGDLVQQKPYLYQEADGRREEVDGRFVLGTQYSDLSTQRTSLVTFDVGAYDPARPLVVDPLVLGYSTYLGGGIGSDDGAEIAVDTGGNAYVAGSTNSNKFPVTAGAFDTSSEGFEYDAFIAKLTPDGGALIYATYLGGAEFDDSHNIDVDRSGATYVTGHTASADFPTTPGAFDRTYDAEQDAYVAKLSANGSALAYSTYLGGSGSETGHKIAIDSDGNANLVGQTDSRNFPTTSGAFDTTYNGNVDAFVVKLAANGAFLVYSTYLGGAGGDWGFGVSMDRGSNVVVTRATVSADFPVTPGAFDTTYNGNGDIFTAKLRLDGAALIYAGYLGGSGSESYEAVLDVDVGGNAYVTGATLSSDFPTTQGAFDTTYNDTLALADAFIAKLSADGSQLVYSSYLGGSSVDGGHGIILDANENAYVTGATTSTNFPTTPGAFDHTYNGGIFDAFVAKLSADGSELNYSTYLGGSGDDLGLGIAAGGSGNVYVTGYTLSTNFPTTPGAFKQRYRSGYTDAFVTKFSEV